MIDFLRAHKWAFLAAVAAVVVRWIYLIELAGQEGFSIPMVDEKWHWEWALQIIHGPFFGDGTWFRAPLYPYVLAFLAFISGESIFIAKFLQLIICGGTAFFLARLGTHLFGRTAGAVAGFIYAFYGAFVYYDAMFLIEILFVFFLAWGMFRLVAYADSEKISSWLFTGVVFGLAAISRPNVLLVIPLLLVWVYFVPLPKRSRDNRLRWQRPVLLLIGLGLAIAPVTVRNIVVTGDFTLISSQGGVNLYLGNNKAANGLTMRMAELELSESLSWDKFQPATLAAAERLAGRTMTEGEASDFWTQKSIEFITENPGMFLGLLWRKTVYLLSGFENSDNSDIYYERGKSKLYSLLLWDGPIDFPYGLLLPLTLAGIYLRRGESKKLWPVYLFILGYIPTIILFLVTARHRLAVIAFMIVIAAAGLAKALELMREKRYRDIGIGTAIFAIALAVFNQTYYEEGGRNDFQIHFNEGIKHEQFGNIEAAEREYRLANAAFGESSALLSNLGHVQYQLGKFDEADRSYQRALRIDSTFHRTLNNLGLLVEDRGNVDSALGLYRKARAWYNQDIARENELGQIYLNIGRALERTGNVEEAKAYFDSSAESSPGWSKGLFQAAAFFARQGDYVRSDTLFFRARALNKPSAADYFNWGLSYVERKEYANAAYMLQRAIREDSTVFQAHYVIAVAYYEDNQPWDSVMVHAETAVRLNPQYQPAVQFLEHLRQAAGGQ